jgi:tetratricopeptide (TPR) repeat protein
LTHSLSSLRLGLSLAALALAGSAAGGTPLEEAKSLTSSAEIQYKLAHFQEAADAYTKAYELYPTPDLLFDIGQCQRMLKNHERAVFFFEGYLRDKPGAANRAVVEQLIADSKAELQKEAAAAPPPKPAGEPPPPAAPSPPPPPPPPRGSSTVAITGLALAGLGLGAVGTGIYFGLKASSDASDISNLSSRHGAWNAQYQSEYDSGNRAATIATVLFIAGGVTAGAGAALAFFAWPRSAPAVTVTPTKAGTLLTLSGQF